MQKQGHYNTFIYNTHCSHLGSFFVYLENLLILLKIFK